MVILIILTYLVFFLQSIFGEIFLNIKKEDPCNLHCEKTHLLFGKIDYIKSCCYRGCRFFKLVEADLNILNDTKSACESSCNEAYIDMYEQFACYKGCDFMARNRISDYISSCSNKIYSEESMDLNLLLMLPDMPETDILSDPGLRKELLPGWWYYTGFKLPQTFIKTVPKNSKIIDYGIFPDYTSDVEKTSTIYNGWRLEWKSGVFALFIIVINTLILLIWLLLKLRSNDNHFLRNFWMKSQKKNLYFIMIDVEI